MEQVELPELSGYAAINNGWGCDPKAMRKLTDKEAILAAKLLVKEGFKAYGDGKKATGFKFMIAPRKNCYTWPRGRKKFYVNPDRHGEGLSEMVHSISHYVHWKCHPKHGGHTLHAAIEMHLIDFAIKNNFHNAALLDKLKK